MMIQAVLGNPHHPEYGVATIPFPIPRDQYAHCIVPPQASVTKCWPTIPASAGRWMTLSSTFMARKPLAGRRITSLGPSRA